MKYHPISLPDEDLQSILADSARLAGEIGEVKNYLAYLEESQYLLYPTQAPARGRTRRNKRRTPAPVVVAGQYYSRIQRSVDLFMKNHSRPPTLREISQRIRARDLEQLVCDMVEQGMLKEVTEEGRKTKWYASTGLTFEEKQQQDEQRRLDNLHKERETQERQGHESMSLVLEAVRQLIESKGEPLVRPSEVREHISHLPYWGDAINLLKATGQLLVVDEYGKGTWYTLP